jgi:Icc-related predicted phosphoesterase
MKIVSISDVHMATRNLGRMSEVWRECDLAIIAGDLTNFGGVDDARKVLDDVRDRPNFSLTSKIPRGAEVRQNLKSCGGYALSAAAFY